MFYGKWTSSSLALGRAPAATGVYLRDNERALKPQFPEDLPSLLPPLSACKQSPGADHLADRATLVLHERAIGDEFVQFPPIQLDPAVYLRDRQFATSHHQPDRVRCPAQVFRRLLD